MVGIRKATRMMMYCATWVQVMPRMPPRKEQTRMLASPRKMPTEKSTPVKREAIRPTA